MNNYEIINKIEYYVIKALNTKENSTCLPAWFWCWRSSSLIFRYCPLCKNDTTEVRCDNVLCSRPSQPTLGKIPRWLLLFCSVNTCSRESFPVIKWVVFYGLFQVLCLITTLYRFKFPVVLINNWISMHGHIASCMLVRTQSFSRFKSAAKHISQGGQWNNEYASNLEWSSLP